MYSNYKSFVGLTPAWAHGTATYGTRTRVQYRLHYAVHLLGPWLETLSTLVALSYESQINQTPQTVLGASP